MLFQNTIMSTHRYNERIILAIIKLRKPTFIIFQPKFLAPCQTSYEFLISGKSFSETNNSYSYVVWTCRMAVSKTFIAALIHEICECASVTTSTILMFLSFKKRIPFRKQAFSKKSTFFFICDPFV